MSGSFKNVPEGFRRLRMKEAAEYVGCSERTMNSYRNKDGATWESISGAKSRVYYDIPMEYLNDLREKLQENKAPSLDVPQKEVKPSGTPLKVASEDPNRSMELVQKCLDLSDKVLEQAKEITKLTNTISERDSTISGLNNQLSAAQIVLSKRNVPAEINPSQTENEELKQRIQQLEAQLQKPWWLFWTKK